MPLFVLWSTEYNFAAIQADICVAAYFLMSREGYKEGMHYARLCID